MDISRQIQELRKSQGLSQEQLAEAVSVSRQAVSKWESGQSQPDLDKLLQLSRVFDLSVDALLSDNPLAARAAAQSIEAEQPPEDDDLDQLTIDFSADDDENDTRFVIPGADERDLTSTLAIGAAAGAAAVVGVVAITRLLFPKKKR